MVISKLAAYIDDETYKALESDWVDLPFDQLELRIYELLAEQEKPAGWYQRKLLTKRQEENESVTQFMLKLNGLAEKAFGPLLWQPEAQGMVRFQFLSGLRDRRLAENLSRATCRNVRELARLAAQWEAESEALRFGEVQQVSW